MSILDGYIARSIFVSVFVVLFILVGLDAVFSFIGELEDLQGNFQMLEALRFILLTVPGKIYEFIPVATLIGCLIALGNLANNSELTVMRASGISVLRIVIAALKPVLLFVIVALALGEFIVPKMEQQAKSEKVQHFKGDQTLRIKIGYWYRDDDAFINIRAIEPDGIVWGVSRFFFDKEGLLTRSEFSERAEYKGGYWMLYDVKATELSETRAQVEEAASQRWNTQLTPDFLATIAIEPDHLSITGLWRYANQLAKQKLKSNDYFFAFWKKALQPIATFVMVFIALSFIFGPLRSVTVGQRLIAGIVTGLSFNYAQDLLGHVSIVFNVSPFIAAMLPIGLCAIAAVYFMRRA